MSTRHPNTEYVVCVDNADYPVSLELHKIYRTARDQDALGDGDIRIIDESGEDYLFPSRMFVAISPPERVRSSLGADTVTGDSRRELEPQIGQRDLERLASRMYNEVFRCLEDPLLRGVVKDKVTAMFGPPMMRPDIALVSFQGGAGDQSPSRRTWPHRLVYLEGNFPFGRTLRSQFRTAGLYESLERRTVAMAACFPEAPVGESRLWTTKTGPRAQWRQFSSHWVRRMLRAMRPHAVLVFGKNASIALDLEGGWRDEEHRASDGHRVFGRAEIEGCPAIYCHHLSQGFSTYWAQACLADLARVVRSSH